MLAVLLLRVAGNHLVVLATPDGNGTAAGYTPPVATAVAPNFTTAYTAPASTGLVINFA